MKFFNNIVKSDGNVSKFSNTGVTGYFSNNCFYPAAIDDINGPSNHPGLITAEPMLVDPGKAGIGIINTTGYKLQGLSPCIDAGIMVSDSGERDFWGNSLYNATPDIGAHEYQNKPVGEITVDAEADAYVRNGSYVSSNFGDEMSLTVKADATGYARKSFVRFNYNNFKKHTVESAKIRLYVSGVNTSLWRTVKIYGTDDKSWNETEITWKNAPVGNSLLGEVNVSNTSDLWYELDVTDYINSNMSDKTVSFLVTNEGESDSKSDVSFASREMGPKAPELVIK